MPQPTWILISPASNIFSTSSYAPEFAITRSVGTTVRVFFHSQLFITPPYPTHPFTNQTIIVTGTNKGLGLETARHFYRLNCARLILAVRDVKNGYAAKEDILSSVNGRAYSKSDATAIQVWHLDLRSTASTIALAGRVKTELDRVDVLVKNAAVHTGIFELVKGVEQALQESSRRRRRDDNLVPHLVVVSSEAHRFTSFLEINAPDLYKRMGGSEGRHKSYCATKLIEVLFVRELVARLGQKTNEKMQKRSPNPPPAPATPEAEAPPPVIISLVNPGFCSTTLGSDGKPFPLLVRIIRSLLDRTVEVGSRTLASRPRHPRARTVSFRVMVRNQDVGAWIYEDVGRRAQAKVFEQTMRILEER
ncbi:NAD(P)-binding protein [Aspergillus insuetus]